MLLFAKDGNGNRLGSRDAGGTVTDEWKKFELTYTLPPNTDQINPRLDNDGPVGTVIYWDGWKLEKNDTATSFGDGSIRPKGHFDETM